MKIIDILVGKETPNKFKYNAGTFERQNNGGYIDEDGDNLTEWIFSDYSNIYDEVEIIEEETKPLTKKDIEALGYACGEIQKCFTNGWNKSLENKPFKEDKEIEKININDNGTIGFPNGQWTARNMDKAFAIKINELIDKVNNMEDNK